MDHDSRRDGHLETLAKQRVTLRVVVVVTGIWYDMGSDGRGGAKDAWV